MYFPMFSLTVFVKIRLKYITFLLFFFLTVFELSAQDLSFSTNLPIVYIDTKGRTIGDKYRTISDMEIAWKGDGSVNNTSDNRNYYSGKINIELRGSTSQNFPKKSYGFELKDDDEEDMDFPLLGMPKEEDWILYAPYTDKTLIRNVLAYALASQISTVYTPRCRFVELFVNEKYEGIYVLMEKIKRDKNRVDIAKLKADDISGEELTGGYIVKIDKTTGSGGDGWHSKFRNINNAKTFYQYEYPKSDKITEEQKNYINDYFDKFETEVHNRNFDEQTGYMNYINATSFFDMIFINELSKNIDGYRLSTFLYKDKNDKLTAGPVWDYNIAFGNANYYNGWETTGIEVFNTLGKDFRRNPFWWATLLSDSHFSNPMKSRWKTLRKNKLSDKRVMAVVDSLTAIVAGAVNRNFERWPILGEFVHPNYFVGDDYDSEVVWMKSWILERLSYLDERLPGTGVASSIQVVSNNEINNYRVYPNPFSTEISIQIQSEQNSQYTFCLFTLNGQKIKERQFNIVKGANRLKINTTDIQKGMYFYRLTNTSAKITSGKIVKF